METLVRARGARAAVTKALPILNLPRRPSPSPPTCNAGEPQGLCAEKTAAEMGISRAAQDEFAITSYKRSGAWRARAR